MIDIFRIDFRFFIHEKVYEVRDSKFHGFAPKRLHFDASHGRLHFDASPKSDVFIEIKRLQLYLKLMSTTATSQAQISFVECLQHPFRAQWDVYGSLSGADGLHGTSTTAFQSSAGCLLWISKRNCDAMDSKCLSMKTTLFCQNTSIWEVSSLVASWLPKNLISILKISIIALLSIPTTFVCIQVLTRNPLR